MRAALVTKCDSFRPLSLVVTGTKVSYCTRACNRSNFPKRTGSSRRKNEGEGRTEGFQLEERDFVEEEKDEMGFED